MHTLARFILLFLVTILAHSQEQGITLELKIENISNDKGQMLIGLYDSESSWLKTPLKGLIGEITNGTCAVNFEGVPDGTYAISVFHDEDKDGELKMFLGIPREAIGNSNDASARFGPPEWEDAKFEVKGEKLNLVIHM